MLEIFNPQSTPLSDFFTSDPAVISYRNQTFSDMLCNPAPDRDTASACACPAGHYRTAPSGK